MAFQLPRRTLVVMLMVPMCPESGFSGTSTRPARPLAKRRRAGAAWRGSHAV